MPALRLWQDLTSPDFSALDPERTVAVLPLGAVEQHGPHLPVSTDAVIAEALAHQAAQAVQGDVSVIVLPTSTVGKSNEHIDFPGTLTLRADTLTAVWSETGASVARAGIRKLLMLNTHGGQLQVMEIVARELRIQHEMLAVACNWWDVGKPPNLVPDDELRHGIHGGTVETSVMLHLRPDLVRMDHAADFRSVLGNIESRYEQLRLVGGPSVGWKAQDLHPLGVAGNAQAATVAIGQAIVDYAVKRLATMLTEVASYPLANLVEPPQLP